MEWGRKGLSGNFAFLLPVMMFTFGCAFWVAARWDSVPARFWGSGYLCAAAAFCVPLWPDAIPMSLRAFAANLLFGISFLLYGQALEARLGKRTPGPLRIAVLTVSIVATVIAMQAGSLRAELVASDLGCGLLLLIPMFAWRRHLALPGGRALMVATGLVVLDNLLRASTVVLTAPATTGSFLSSLYAFVMQSAAMVLGMVMALAALASVVLEALERYRRQAGTDPLSGLLNRRGLEEATGGMALRPGTSVVLCDIDRFKAINDRCGHDVGDKVIAGLADTIRASIPKGALAARIGGEEFVVLLPYLGHVAAARLADAMRMAFSSRDWRAIGMEGVATASFGVAAVRADDMSLHDAIRRADMGLYDAKHAGRDRVGIKAGPVLVHA
jgi:diguanylate cyclase (GGDEF)-like protein